jgi:hypothetical protein
MEPDAAHRAFLALVAQLLQPLHGAFERDRMQPPPSHQPRRHNLKGTQ